MPVYRVTLYANDRGRGESESYLTNNASPSVLGPRIQTLIQQRVNLMAPEVTVDGVRISNYGSLRRSQLMVPGLTSDVWLEWGQKLNLNFFGAGPTPSSDLPYAIWGSSLQQIFTFDTNRKAIRYLVGVPRNITSNPLGTTQTDNEATWWNNLATFNQTLFQTGWQLEAFIQPTNPALYAPIFIGNTTGITDVYIGVNTGSFPFVPTLGQKLRVQGFRPAKGTRAPTINGTWYVSGFDTTSTAGMTKIYLRNSSAVIPALQRFTPKSVVLPTDKQPFAISAVLPIRVVTRKRGRAFLVPRGRRLTHVSLDP